MLKKRRSATELGRSMIEMAGVLAIVAILSYLGYLGYVNAMGTVRVNKIIDLHQRMVTNLEHVKSVKSIPANVTMKDWFDMGVLNLENYDVNENIGFNAFQGGLDIKSEKDKGGRIISIKYTELPFKACTSLATTDWGFNTSGLVALDLNGIRMQWSVNGGENNLPVALPRAMTLCEHDDINALTFYYQ